MRALREARFATHLWQKTKKKLRLLLFLLLPVVICCCCWQFVDCWAFFFFFLVGLGKVGAGWKAMRWAESC